MDRARVVGSVAIEPGYRFTRTEAAAMLTKKKVSLRTALLRLADNLEMMAAEVQTMMVSPRPRRATARRRPSAALRPRRYSGS